jgi:TonB family protein
MGAISLILLACGPKRYEPEPASISSTDSIAVTADSTAPGGPLFEFQVTKPVLPMEDNPYPRYPYQMAAIRAEGEVLVQFVVDTLGRAEMSTYKVLKATNPEFAQSVHDVVRLMKFHSAEKDGKKVRQWVRLPFKFRVAN